jgi:hypothetical protein
MCHPRLLSLLAAGTLAGALGAAPVPELQLRSLALERLKALRPALGLGPAHTFQVRSVAPDPVLGGADVRVDQYFRGVRVMQGEAVLHLREGLVGEVTDGLKRSFTVDTLPNLTPSEALAVAAADLAPRGPFAHPPTCELVVARLKLGPGTPALRDALLYRIRLALENGVAETSSTDYLIDAHTGAVAKRWDSLRTLAEGVGWGRSQYNGKVGINVTPTRSGFELRDGTRGSAACSTPSPGSTPPPPTTGVTGATTTAAAPPPPTARPPRWTPPSACSGPGTTTRTSTTGTASTARAPPPPCGSTTTPGTTTPSGTTTASA